PTMLRASWRGAEAGVISVAAGDPPRMLVLHAADAAGHVTERRLVLRRSRPGESFRSGVSRRRVAHGLDLRPVDGPFVRVRYSGAPAGAREVMVGLEGQSQALRPASPEANGWTAVVRVPPGVTTFVAKGRTASQPWEDRKPVRVVPVSRQKQA